jgi:parallel beta-helix repeat protein
VMDGAAHVVLEGLRLEYAVGAAVSAEGVVNITISNCTISNCGTDGILLNGSNATVTGCHIYDTGCNAVNMNSGDIPSLTRGNTALHSNTLHRFARVTRTRAVGVMWSGCGNVVSANEIFDAPYIGVLMNGHGGAPSDLSEPDQILGRSVGLGLGGSRPGSESRSDRSGLHVRRQQPARPGARRRRLGWVLQRQDLVGPRERGAPQQLQPVRPFPWGSGAQQLFFAQNDSL